jgi:hypothetical protein
VINVVDVCGNVLYAVETQAVSRALLSQLIVTNRKLAVKLVEPFFGRRSMCINNFYKSPVLLCPEEKWCKCSWDSVNEQEG